MGVLDEIQCWDKLEAANFPVKIGATYRWGKSPELWDFDFLAGAVYNDEPRPGKFLGQRKRTTWQVDRAKYDQILLDHARELGCDVSQNTRVVKVKRTGDKVDSIELAEGSSVTAKYYVDASGHSGILRRSMGIATESPTTLQNIAIWDYYQNADWAVRVGAGGTRVYVMSLQYGWIWFIPISPTRTSIGLVIPASYYKQSGMKPDALYQKALGEDPLIVSLMKNAKSEGLLQTTKDWSFMAERVVGENWFLVGECAGFADPILSAGLTMTHLGAREAAYTILDLLQQCNDPEWLRSQFEKRQRDRLLTHIRFADYWYTANAQFEDLKEFSSQLAQDVGLELSPEKAWAWLAQGGFISDELLVGIGGYSLDFLRQSNEYIGNLAAESPLEKYNVFRPNFMGAEVKEFAFYKDGKVVRSRGFQRNGRTLPTAGPVALILHALESGPSLAGILSSLKQLAEENGDKPGFMMKMSFVPEMLEAMVLDGWIDGAYDPNRPLAPVRRQSSLLRWNSDSGFQNSEGSDPSSNGF
jgi:flavin-dependent dehydrogenase